MALNNKIIIRQALWKIYDHKCFYCGEILRFRDTTIDHIIPTKIIKKEEWTEKAEDYGLNASFNPKGMENLVPACLHCNSSKGGKSSPQNAWRYLEFAQKNKKKVEEEYKKLKEKISYTENIAEPFKTERIITKDSIHYYSNQYWNSLSDICINGHLPARYMENGSCLIQCRTIEIITTLNAEDICKLIERKKQTSLENIIPYGSFRLDNEEYVMVVINNSTIYLSPDSFSQLIIILSDFLDTYESFLQSEYIDFLGLEGFQKIDDKYYTLMETSRVNWKRLIDFSKKYDMDAEPSDSPFHFNYNGGFICALHKETNVIVFILIPAVSESYNFNSFQYPDNNMQILWQIPSIQYRNHIANGKVFTLQQTYQWVCSIINRPLEETKSTPFKIKISNFWFSLFNS